MAVLYTVDKYGVTNYRPSAKVIVALVVLYSYIGLMAHLLLYVELTNSTHNILSYNDAFWVLQMSASTIGFGDFYPVTQYGRWIVATTFYIGVGLAGYVGTTLASSLTDFADSSVQNRELRKQNAEIISLLKQKEIK